MNVLLAMQGYKECGKDAGAVGKFSRVPYHKV